MFLGKRSAARQGKDVQLSIGKNVHAEANEVIASISSQLVIANGNLNVLPVIEIKGDIDLSTGNIQFSGSVILHSTVCADKKVIVEGKQGLIAGGQVSAGDEIRCKNAGTHLAVATELAIGSKPDYQRRIS